MQHLHVTREDESLRLTGPAGEVGLIVKHTREVERTEDEPNTRDRVALELAWTTAIPDAPEQVADLTVLYVYTRDSYDDEHRLVLEDNVVNERLLAALRTQLGVDGTDLELVAAVGAALPEFAPSLDVLVATWDDRYVPNGYPRGQI